MADSSSEWNGYTLIAKTTSNSSAINYEFLNVPNGEYLIIARDWIMSKDYVQYRRIEVKDGAVTVPEFSLVSLASNTELEPYYDIYDATKDLTAAGGGTYTVNGTVRTTSGPRSGSTVLLLKEPPTVDISNYKVVSATTSNAVADGPNFELTNVSAGHYVVLAGWIMGSTYYVSTTEVSVDSDTGNIQDYGEINVIKSDAASDPIRDLFIQLKDTEDTNDATAGGMYNITGVANYTTSAGLVKSRASTKIILLQSPVIADVSERTEGTISKITVTALGDESVTVTYTDKDGKVSSTKASDQKSNGAYTFSIDKENLPAGRTDVTVTAKNGNYISKKTVAVINADPALLNVPKKVVIISGYETHNKIIQELAADYTTQNVELVSIETKKVPSMSQAEIDAALEGADVITIHMVSTTPTWNDLESAIKNQTKKGATVTLFDDNSTRYTTSYGTYARKSIPGISDTTANADKYQAKISDYWSNTPYDHSNLEQMINMILIDFYGRYDLPAPNEPVTLPLKAIYHPNMEMSMGSVFEANYTDYINWYKTNDVKWDGEEQPITYDASKPTVAIAFYKSYFPDKMEPIAKLIEELEKTGVNVVAAYCESPTSFDTADSGGAYFIAGETDIVLNYRYIGEHRFNQTNLDIPVFNILIVDSAADWETSTHPLGNSSTKLVNQELQGFIDPIAIVSTEVIDGATVTKPMNEQIDWFVSRINAQINLQQTANADKNIAVVYYDHGGGKANIGASYLDVPNSTVELLKGMETAGYNIDTSKAPDADALIQSMLAQGINVGGWAPGELKKLVGDVSIPENTDIYDNGKAVFISKTLYLEWFRDVYLGDWFEATIAGLDPAEQTSKRTAQEQLYQSKLKEVEDLWGTAPGNIMVYQDKYIIIPYIDVTDESGTGDGRVILTPQPSRGNAESIEVMYHDTNIPPNHQYIAFYLWLQHKNDLQSAPQELGFDADAIIHLGRHGTQEWLPGKETALSRYDWPAVMAGHVPIIYPYIVDGVGEGMTAKRRGNAVLVDHMTPAIIYAELYGDYAILSGKIQSYQSLQDGDTKNETKATIITLLNTTAIDIRLGKTKAQLTGMDNADFEKELEKVDDVLEDLRSSYMPYGLHILGKPMEGDVLVQMVYSMMGANYVNNVTNAGLSQSQAYSLLKQAVLDGESPKGIAAGLSISSDNKYILTKELNRAREYGNYLGKPLSLPDSVEVIYYKLDISDTESYSKNATAAGLTESQAYSILTDVVVNSKTPEEALSTYSTLTPAQKTSLTADLTKAIQYKNEFSKHDREIDQILNALNGKYIESKVGGDPVSRPHVMPTGGNFQTIDQRLVPSKEAWDVAVKLTDELLRKYYEEHGEWPKSIAFVLWAGETTRHEGVMEAQIMYLIGVKPKWSSTNIVDASNFEAIPAADLKVTLSNGTVVQRPRIDVVVEISGLYRDTFPDKVLMLDRAVRFTYTLDGTNYIKENTDALISKGYSKDQSLSRVFGPAADTYGVGMETAIGSTNTWDDNNKLADFFISRMGYVYNSLGSWGSENNQQLYKDNLGKVDATVMSRSSPLYGVLDNDDVYQYLGGLNLAVEKSRADGKKPDSYITNLQRAGGAEMTTLGDYLGNELISRPLNPKWQEGMREHGYAGAREMDKAIENLWGWAALNPDLITDKMWNDIYEALLTGDNEEWLKNDPNNAYSYQSAVARMLQVATKEDGKYWNADSAVLNDLINQYVDSVVQHGVACCDHTCGNPFFDQFIAGQMSVAGVSEEKQKQFLDTLKLATEREIEPTPGSKTSGGSGGGFGTAAVVSGDSGGEGGESSDTPDQGDAGAGYGTDLGQKSGNVEGYQMIEKTADGAASAIRDFMENPTFSASSFVAIALVILAVGAIFYGQRKKNM
ncbi:cobaltochelatase subunit CobN [Methanolapillus africanus]